jgi:chemotaxis protein MotB
MNSKILFLITFIITLPLQSDWIYWKSEYQALDNKKKEVEKELEACRKNRRSDLESRNSVCSETEELLKNLEIRFKDLESNYFTFEKKCETTNLEAQDRILTLEELVKNLDMENKELLDERTQILENHQKKYDKAKRIVSKLKMKNNKYKAEYRSAKTDCDFEIKKLEKELQDLRNLTGTQKEQLERMQNQFQDLEKRLETEIKGGMIQVRKTQNRLTINLDERISFASGSIVLKSDIKPILDKIIQILIQYPENLISIEGHTDDLPMKSNKIRDNWQLSTERALSVLKYILETPNLDPKRCSAAGFGEFRPLVPNNTNENRRINRRVEIVVLLP